MISLNHNHNIDDIILLPKDFGAINVGIEDALYTFEWCKFSYASSILTIMENKPVSTIDCNFASEGIAPYQNDIQTIIKMRNMAAGISFIINLLKSGYANFLEKNIILKVHETIGFGEIFDAGKFRTKNVIISGCAWVPPEHCFVENLFCKLLHIVSKIENPFVRAYAYFVSACRLQPFSDCNKRSSWLIACGILIANGFVPPIFQDESRDNFVVAMKDIYDRKDTTEFEKFIKKCLKGESPSILKIFSQASKRSMSLFRNILKSG